uniref:DUF3288 n=1 Tax=Sciadococcus taiwanensis TaxID=3028030 RepID=A0A9Y1I292_9RHOD|nr:DUF3288 [Sciadococcus taiwanensis]
MFKELLLFRRHYFPPWYEDKKLILGMFKKDFTHIDIVEIARLYVRYYQIEEAYLILELLQLLMKQKQISKKLLFSYTRKIHNVELIYFSYNLGETKKVKPKQYKPTKKELMRVPTHPEVLLQNELLN